MPHGLNQHNLNPKPLNVIPFIQSQSLNLQVKGGCRCTTARLVEGFVQRLMDSVRSSSRYLAFGSSMDYMYSRLHVRYPLTFEVGPCNPSGALQPIWGI